MAIGVFFYYLSFRDPPQKFKEGRINHIGFWNASEAGFVASRARFFWFFEEIGNPSNSGKL